MGRTFVEKVLGGKAGSIVTVSPDWVLSHDNTSAIIKKFEKTGAKKVASPLKCVIILDHVVPAASEKHAANHKKIREWVREQRIVNFFDVGRGICHQVLPEEGFALPGKIIVGADSHTTTHGAFGAFSCGIGRSEVAAIWALDELWFRIPETIRIVINGELPKGVYAKDVVLYITGKIGSDGALYKSIEFSGSTVENFSISSRMVLSNVAAEMGAKNAWIEPDEKILAYLKDRAIEEFTVITTDADADIEAKLEFDVSGLVPQIAAPHEVDNVHPVEEYIGMKFNEGFIGTCTNGRIEDFAIACEILKGKKIHPDVRLIVIPASREIYSKAVRRGYIEIFIEAGALIESPGCGPCLGAHMGVLASGEKALSTANRNFKGRMGSPEAGIYLASPATVAASCIKGEITDPRGEI
ncbi:3-isopropylmalate dehydratase large subunit [candidate division WOR-3 bacterium]|nr:3-isopropylmalate dehydratase large subunit [candidate division WOR-3 bacterium]